MKAVLTSIFSFALMLGIAAAQDSAAPPSASPSSEPHASTTAQPMVPESSTPAPPTRIAAGSVIPVSLTKTIDAKKAKTGDEVVAKVTADVKTSDGEMLVPKDTKVVGHVTEAQPRNKEQKESVVGVAFDHAVMKDGSEMQMPMSIQAIIAPENNQNSAGGSAEGVPSTGSGAYPNSSRPGGMAGSTPSPMPSAPTVGGNVPSDTQTGANARPRITAQTEGVVGISDLKLTAAAPAANQGSLVSSEKNNVKLESGTFMLLRVNQ